MEVHPATVACFSVWECGLPGFRAKGLRLKFMYRVKGFSVFVIGVG